MTTVMLRNIPGCYTREELIERVDKNYKGAFDYLYLPIDFGTGYNFGYAFINFRTEADCGYFMEEFHGAQSKHVLPGYSSSNVCEVRYARVQGRAANMENLQDATFIEKLVVRPYSQPVFYDEDGTRLDFEETFGKGMWAEGWRRKKSGRPSRST